MKKLKGALLLGALIMGLFTSCDEGPKKQPIQQESPLVNGNYNSEPGYTIRTIDNCEYIEIARNINTNWSIYSLTHKGNCKNPIHKK